MIPGLTNVVQPLDACLNKPFKDHIPELWSQWLMDGEKKHSQKVEIYGLYPWTWLVGSSMGCN